MFETDTTLCRKFVRGNEVAFNTLASKWQNHILNFAYQYLGDEENARDVVQEVLIRLYLSLKKFRGDAQFSTLLYRIVTNCCIDTFRKKNSKLNVVSFEDLPPGSDNEIHCAETGANPGTETPVEIAHRNDLGERVRKALAEIPENQRIVIIMKEYSQMKFSEIAEIIETPESTVKSRMYKGLVNLKKVLRKNGIKDWGDIE